MKDFAIRRSRRLLPAGYFVTLITIIFSYFFLVTNYYEEFYSSVISSLSLISNFFFANNSEYFDAPYFLKPLIHTWSLSIEFQFYIFYPLILFCFLRYLNEINIILIFIVICCFNLLFVQLGGNLQISYPYFEKNFSFFNQPTYGTFFYTTSRVWEFLIGAICLFVYRKNIKFNISIYYLGLILIFFSLYIFSKNIDNPGINNLIPVLGVGLILISQVDNSFPKKLLSSNLIVFIGLISYSVYLIHFPLFAFSNYILKDYSKNIEDIIKIFLIFFSFILGYLSWKYIEKPFRNYNFINNKIFLILIILTLFFLFFINELANYKKEKNSELIINQYKKINFTHNKKATPADMSAALKEFGVNEFFNYSKKNFLILGDSQSIDFYMILKSNKNLAKSSEFTYFDDKFEISYLTENSKVAKDFRNRLLKSEKFIFADYIILSSDYKYKELKSIDKHINFLSKFDKKIIVTTVFPNSKFVDPITTILLKNKDKLLDYPEIERKLFENLKINSISKKNKIIYSKLKNKNTLIFDRTNLICNFNLQKCHAITKNNFFVFNDNRHITNQGARFLSNSKILTDFFNNLD